MNNKLFLASVISIFLLSTIFIWYYSEKEDILASNNTILTIGTNADYPPFSFIKDGKIAGFDIDVAKEAARRIEKKVALKDMPFDALIIEAQQGTIDIIAAGMTSTPERTKKLLFTTPHISGDPLIIISLPKDSPVKSVEQLKGKTVVVNEGFVADTYISGIEGIKTLKLPTVAEGFLALQSRQADAFVTARNSAQLFFEKYGKDGFNILPIEGTSDSYSLAIPLEKKELFDAIQKALYAMAQDGTLEKLKQKWKLL